MENTLNMNYRTLGALLEITYHQQKTVCDKYAKIAMPDSPFEVKSADKLLVPTGLEENVNVVKIIKFADLLSQLWLYMSSEQMALEIYNDDLEYNDLNVHGTLCRVTINNKDFCHPATWGYLVEEETRKQKANITTAEGTGQSPNHRCKFCVAENRLEVKQFTKKDNRQTISFLEAHIKIEHPKVEVVSLGLSVENSNESSNPFIGCTSKALDETSVVGLEPISSSFVSRDSTFTKTNSGDDVFDKEKTEKTWQNIDWSDEDL